MLKGLKVTKVLTGTGVDRLAFIASAAVFEGHTVNWGEVCSKIDLKYILLTLGVPQENFFFMLPEGSSAPRVDVSTLELFGSIAELQQDVEAKIQELGKEVVLLDRLAWERREWYSETEMCNLTSFRRRLGIKIGNKLKVLTNRQI